MKLIQMGSWILQGVPGVFLGGRETLDEHQIKYLLYDFVRGVLGLLPVVFLI